MVWLESTARAFCQARSLPSFIAQQKKQKSRLSDGGLPWKELPHRTEFVVRCSVAVSFRERNFHKHHKTRRWNIITQAGHKMYGSSNCIIKDFFSLLLEGARVLANKYWILVSHWILMTGWLDAVLQRREGKEEGLLERGSECPSWARRCSLVLACSVTGY